MNWIELTAVVLGFINVWLTVRQNIWCWPPGLLSTALYIYIFFHSRLYSETILQIIFVVMQCYGWYYWARAGKTPETEVVPVVCLSTRLRWLWGAVTLGGALLLGTTMKHLTNADLPYLDASVTAMSLTAQHLMNVKILESWLLWITVDIISIGIFFVKKLHFTMGLYMTFLVMACLGFRAWRASWKSQNAA